MSVVLGEVTLTSPIGSKIDFAGTVPWQLAQYIFGELDCAMLHSLEIYAFWKVPKHSWLERVESRPIQQREEIAAYDNVIGIGKKRRAM